VSSDKPSVCRLLRTKSDGGIMVGGEVVPWTTGENTSASYWCLATMETAGPDDNLAHPHTCLRSRVCYRPGDS